MYYPPPNEPIINTPIHAPDSYPDSLSKHRHYLYNRHQDRARTEYQQNENARTASFYSRTNRYRLHIPAAGKRNNSLTTNHKSSKQSSAWDVSKQIPSIQRVVKEKTPIDLTLYPSDGQYKQNNRGKFKKPKATHDQLRIPLLDPEETKQREQEDDPNNQTIIICDVTATSSQPNSPIQESTNQLTEIASTEKRENVNRDLEHENVESGHRYETRSSKKPLSESNILDSLLKDIPESFIDLMLIKPEPSMSPIKQQDETIHPITKTINIGATEEVKEADLSIAEMLKKCYKQHQEEWKEQSKKEKVVPELLCINIDKVLATNKSNDDEKQFREEIQIPKRSKSAPVITCQDTFYINDQKQSDSNLLKYIDFPIGKIEYCEGNMKITSTKL